MQVVMTIPAGMARAADAPLGTHLCACGGSRLEASASGAVPCTMIRCSMPWGVEGAAAPQQSLPTLQSLRIAPRQALPTLQSLRNGSRGSRRLLLLMLALVQLVISGR